MARKVIFEISVFYDYLEIVACKKFSTDKASQGR